MATLTTIPAVETPLLILREIEMRDAEHFSRFMIQPDYQKHTAMKFGDDAEVKAFVTRCLARQGDDRRNVFHLAAEEKLSGEAVGDGFIIAQRAGLHEVGWGVHPAMWASGYGTEIGRALLGLGFERLKAERIWCKVMTENEASIKLARRIGMRHLKSSPDYPAGNGRYEAVEIFAISADEYFDLAY
jgi:[ribosomal protein S5]-alanine N-acetyltransferase